jgi:hypothetical protein
MTVRNGALRLKRPVENITPDVEHRRFLVLAREIVIEDIMCAVWPVIEAVTHRLGFGYASHVWGYSCDLRGRTLMDGPP